MKYFSCQPDSHNGFGLLIGHTLMYFTVECDQPETVGANISNSIISSSSSNNNNNRNNNNNNNGSDSNAASNSEKGTSRAHVQYTVTLPQEFGLAPQCFSMANRSLYGFDMAFVGASTGVMAVVVMATSSVIYVPGRNIASLRTFPTAAATPAAARQGDHRAASHVYPQSNTGTIGASAFYSPSLGLMSESDRGVGTITWMRDKPLVFVGFMSGRVEWYHVTIAASTQKAEMGKGHAGAATTPVTGATTVATSAVEECPSRGNRSVEGQEKAAGWTEAGSVTRFSGDCALPPSIWMHNSFWQRGTIQKVHENGEGEGVRIRLHLSCAFYDTGGFLTSDWFPATGHVVAGAERAIHVFSTEQPGVPLYSVLCVGCSFLACHPCLPIVGCLSFGRSAETGKQPDACVLHVFEWTTGGTLFLAAEKRTFHGVPRHDVYYSCSWKFSADRQLAICNVVEGAVHVLHLAKTEEGFEAASQEGTETSLSSSSSLPRPLYTFNREREAPIPLHSLINIEFISAATHALPELTPPTSSLSLHNTRGVLVREHMLARRMLHSSGPRRKVCRSHDSRAAAKAARIQRGNGNRQHHHHDNKGAGGSGCGGVGCRDVCFHCATARDDPGVKKGAGAFSRIVGINHAGELTTIPVDADARISILGSGCFAASFCGSVFVGSGDVHQMDTGQRMKRRLVAGFGVPAAANVQALCEFNDPSDEDLRVLFAYISIMETVGAVGSSGPVPSIIELLSLANAPNTTKLMALNLLPHGITVVCGSSTSPNDSRRLLLLQLLNWIPSEESFSCGEGNNEMCEYTRCDELERAVAVEVLHNRRPRAVTLLQRHKQLNSKYTTIAGLLEYPDFILNTLRGGAMEEAQDCFLKQWSPWLQVVFLHEMNRKKIYTNVGLPFWDRIAIAVILESDTSRLISILSSTFARECNMLQRLLLLEGISERTCPLMQMIVDCTGDFQLAACLFARIGARDASSASVSTTSTPLVASLQGRVDAADRMDAAKPEYLAPPWDLWAAAYRTFLNDEGEFVKRTMFDLACQQLRESHVLQLTPQTTTHQRQQERLRYPEVQFYSRRFFQPSLSSLSPFTSALSAKTDPLQHCALSYPLLATGHSHCSVCSSLVYLRSSCAQDSLAWCTACLHGGHANHLQEWFSTHRKCPVYGCSCRCEQVGTESYGEGGRAAFR
ncbi:hypothetical protein TcYC6_0117960 [Trypanosoma cruzi]|nr:hypothetical protein TcYC6_0117960 [Trypanosoma cruzi]